MFAPDLHQDPIEHTAPLPRRRGRPASIPRLSLATADASGNHRSGVLLRGVDARGFVFFTNYESRKGLSDGESAPRSSALADAGGEIRSRQVERVSAEESDAYLPAGRARAVIGA